MDAWSLLAPFEAQQVPQTQAVLGQARMLYPTSHSMSCRMLFLYRRRLWRKFPSNLSVSSQSSPFFALFCQFATEAWMWSDCQSGLLHRKHRTIQFVVCGISWEAPEGNERRGYKYYRHLPQYGARWGDVTPPVPVRFLFL